MFNTKKIHWFFSQTLSILLTLTLIFSSMIGTINVSAVEKNNELIENTDYEISYPKLTRTNGELIAEKTSNGKGITDSIFFGKTPLGSGISDGKKINISSGNFPFMSDGYYYDCDISGVNFVDSTQNGKGIYANGYDPDTMTYDQEPDTYVSLTYGLDAVYDFDEFWFFGDSVGEIADKDFNLQTGVYELYASDELDNLYDSNSKILTYVNRKNQGCQKIVFNTKPSGRFFGVKIIEGVTRLENDGAWARQYSYCRIPEIALFGSQSANQSEGNMEMQNIKFTDVKITDDFWSGRQKQSLMVGIEACANNLKSSIGNFENDAKVVAGDDYTKYEMQSNFAADSDVYKLIEGMAYAYANYKDSTNAEEKAAVEKISNYFNEWIPKIAAAQFEDGYLNSLFTLHNGYGGGAGGTSTGLTKADRFKILGWHEFYCAGHLYEAAIAVYNATSDTRLLEVSVKNFDLLYDIFITGNHTTYDPGEWTDPGHEEIELALIKLALVLENIEKYGKTYSDKCIEFSQMVMDKSRVVHEDSKGGEINESQLKTLPLNELTEAWGHCVRAFYRYTGMTDMNLYKKEMVYKNLETLWNNVETKTYVTGGIGNDRYTEGFASSYDLDNDHSYCETCSSMSNVFWNKSMNLLYGSSKYYDNIEKQLYNNVISGIGLEGDTFYYQNRLTNAGGVSRPTWYGTPCCPTNLMRFIQKMGEYIYTYDSNTLAVNLYIGNSANVKIGNNTIGINMTSSMPWDGNAAIILNPESNATFTLKLRMPSWAKGTNVLKINGVSEKITVNDDGYIAINREWKKGDKIELELPMSVELVDNSDKVSTNEGLIAVTRGPVTYAIEQIDNEEDYNNYCVNASSTFETVKTNSFIADNTYNTATLQLLKVNTQTLDDYYAGNGRRTTLTMIPFYAWANRGLTPMKVYVSSGQKDTRENHNLAYYAEASASFTYQFGQGSDKPSNMNDGVVDVNKRWTSWEGSYSDLATKPTVELDFKRDVILKGTQVYFFDDGGGTKLPDSVTIQYWNGSEYKDVEQLSAVTPIKDDYTNYSFKPIVTTKLRLKLEGNNHAMGIVEWGVTGAFWDRVMIGDFNGDKVIDIRDLVRAKSTLAGTAESVEMNSDLNWDGAINTNDLVLLRKYLLGATPGNVYILGDSYSTFE